jgi:hypothetical protein
VRDRLEVVPTRSSAEKEVESARFEKEQLPVLLHSLAGHAGLWLVAIREDIRPAEDRRPSRVFPLPISANSKRAPQTFGTRRVVAG